MHSFRLLFLIQQRFGALLEMLYSVGFVMVIHVWEMLSEDWDSKPGVKTARWVM